MKPLPATSSYLRSSLRLVPGLLVGALGLTGTAHAVPAFARQTGLQCDVCHTAYPQLTQFGREFKLQGYTMQSGTPSLMDHLAGMLMMGDTHTSAGNNAGTTPIALMQASLFYGGRIIPSYDKLGAFVQVTYDGSVTTWDNTDIRWATSGSLAGKPITWGFDLNNNPTVQDVWNTTPAWGYPFSGANVNDGPNAATLISDPLGGNSLGLGAYASWNNLLYAELSFYKSPSDWLMGRVNGAPADPKISGTAPYWRLALEKTSGPNYYEVGTFGMTAKLYAYGDPSSNTDKYTDTGLDAMYQYTGGKSNFTGRATYVHEKIDNNYSYGAGIASNASDKLNTLALSASYLYDKTYGVDVGYNHIGGTTDAGTYGDTTSNNYTLQLNWLPLNKVAGPSARTYTFNPKLSLIYTDYTKLNGQTGSAASDANSTYLQAWFMF